MFKRLIALIMSAYVFKAEIKIDQAQNFTYGISQGMGFNITIPDLKGCIDVNSQLLEQVQNISSFQNFIDVFKNYFNNMQVCQQANMEGKVFWDHAMNTFSSQKNIDKLLTYSYLKRQFIQDSIFNGTAQFNQQMFYESGLSFGKVVKMLTCAQDQIQDDEFSNFLSFQENDNQIDLMNFLGVFPITPGTCSPAPQSDSIQITQINLQDVPKKGQTISIDAQGTMNEYQDLGSVQITTFLAGVNFQLFQAQLDSRKVDAVSSLDQGQQWFFKYGVPIPGFVPSGQYTIQLQVKNLDETVVKCLTLSFNL